MFQCGLYSRRNLTGAVSLTGRFNLNAEEEEVYLTNVVNQGGQLKGDGLGVTYVFASDRYDSLSDFLSDTNRPLSSA
jgi:hypothetical protein